MPQKIAIPTNKNNHRFPYPKIPIVGFMGVKGSGKDTAFLAAKRWQPDLTRFAFADPLKDMLAAQLGVSRQTLDANKELYRKAMQDLGAEKRKRDKSFWISIMAQQIIQSQPKMIAVTDVRHINEAEYIQGMGGFVIRIRSEWAEKSVDNHASEKETFQAPFDFEVWNHWGYTEDFNHKISAIVNGIVYMSR